MTNVWVTGGFNKTASFGNSNLTASGAATFLAKYSAQGNLLSLKQVNAEGPAGIAIDSARNLLMAGYFHVAATIGNIGLTNSGSGRTFFLAKFDTAGNALWAHNADYPGNDNGFFPCGLALDAAGNSYVAGDFQGVMRFDNSELTLDSGSWMNRDIFVIKYNPSGDILWARQTGGTGDDRCNGMAVKASGDVYLVGQFFNAINGRPEVFAAQYNSNGDLVWARKVGASSAALGYDVTVDVAGNAYLTGAFAGSTTFGNTNLSAPFMGDVFVSKLSTIAPGLSISTSGTNALLRWSALAEGFVLQSANDLTSATWIDEPAATNVVASEITVVLPVTNSPRFFRLKK